ncbi:hypothetical protein EHZ19_15935 [Paraburkholderia bannensis]|nr:hypothetical protein [Paraburkholderia bannensis]RQM47142.1 hypothetical protein EHZ19_15935 [Paraburkholderia bannensis]
MKTTAVAGIDVGGARMGFHLVILQGASILNTVRKMTPAENAAGGYIYLPDAAVELSSPG